jgi:pyridoxal phosphate enzyme (YggS family)
MLVNTNAFETISKELEEKRVTLVAVSKTKPAAAIEALYALGQRDFGENYVQELTEKAPQLPADIRWHFIGHLQTNKVKYIAPIVHLIHGVDSLKLLQEINKQAAKNARVIDCLLQVHIATEETKFGMDESELAAAITGAEHLPNVAIKGLMGMASFTNSEEQVRREFKQLKALKDQYCQQDAILSMGMSGDYRLAIAEGSTMVRIGSLLFGAR